MTIASPTSDFQLILFDGAVEGLTAAFYSVLELTVPLRKLAHHLVWTRRSLPWWIALAEVCTKFPVRKLCLEGFRSDKRVIVKLSRALQPRLGGALRRRGRFCPAIGVAQHYFSSHVPYSKARRSVCLRYQFLDALTQSWASATSSAIFGAAMSVTMISFLRSRWVPSVRRGIW